MNFNSEEQGLDVVSVKVSSVSSSEESKEQQECRFYIDVEARNDAPSIELKDQRELIVNEDEEVVLSGVTYADVDDEILSVSLECDYGTLSWNGSFVLDAMQGTADVLSDRTFTYVVFF